MKNSDGSTRVTWRIWALITAIGLIAVVLLSPVSAKAGNLYRANAIAAGQVIEDDVFLTGEKPIIAGIVQGDVFVYGSDVSITGEVNGSVFVMAENLTLTGRVNGNLFAIVVGFDQQEGSQIGRSLYALAFSLITDRDSSIGRDLNTVAISGRLRGQTARDTNAIIGVWELFKILRDQINRSIIGFAPPHSYNLAKHPAGSGVPHLAKLKAANNAEPSALGNWLLVALQAFLKFLIVGGLMLWVFPYHFQRWVEKLQKAPLASAGYGALVLINGYLVPVLAAILVGGLWLGLLFISLSSLAWTVFWAGYGTLITLFTLFVATVTFLSKAIVAYLVGALILSKVAARALRYRILPLLLGLLIYVPLASIPYLGFFIGLLTTLLGLGSIWLARKPIVQPAETAAEMDQI